MNDSSLSASELDRFELLAAEVQELLMDRCFRDARGVHLETAISGIAAVAGCLLLRATGVRFDKLLPGGPVFVDAADAAGAWHFKFLSGACVKLGLDPRIPWTNPVPENHAPLTGVPELTQTLEAPFDELCARLAAPAVDRPRLALFTAAMLIRIGRDQQLLAPEIGQALALAALVAGTKTVPPPLPAGRRSVWQKMFA